jgi:hypothetical protein
MIYSSLAVLAMSASALVNPFSNLVHMHPRPAQPDTRVSVILQNKGFTFEDVKIGDKVYTVQASHTLSVKAPVGTVVYAASRTTNHRPGDAILELKPELNHQIVNLN